MFTALFSVRAVRMNRNLYFYEAMKARRKTYSCKKQAHHLCVTIQSNVLYKKKDECNLIINFLGSGKALWKVLR